MSFFLTLIAIFITISVLLTFKIIKFNYDDEDNKKKSKKFLEITTEELQNAIKQHTTEKKGTKTDENYKQEKTIDNYRRNKYYNKKNPALTEEEKIQKGKTYEYKCKLLFESRKYKVYPNGYLNGVNDDGIDLICYKEKEVLLVQCKNWINPPKQDDIKIFIANADLFIKKNNSKLKNKKIRKIFITSCNTKDYGVEKFLESYNEQNEIKVEYVIYTL